MLRLSVVSYLNTAPFISGIKKAELEKKGLVEISLDYPAACAQKLISGQVDVGLVPVASLPLLPNYSILGNTCIGANGKVDSVVLLSDVPLQEIEEIVLDFQSLTSINLCRLLARDYWKIDPKFINAEKDFIYTIGKNRAGVVIGDRVFDQANRFKYSYDLSETWYNWKNLPFVFACWVSVNPVLASDWNPIETALMQGISNPLEAAKEVRSLYPAHYPIENYLTERISYNLDSLKRQALETFLTSFSTISAD
jgi:chorismate dehydratase